MKSSAFYAVIGAGVIMIACVIWYGVVMHNKQIVSMQSSGTPTTTPSLTGFSIYTNGQYGFSIFYPQKDLATSTFDSQYHLPVAWRVNALPNASGTPVFAITGYSTKSDNSYPRYFETEVRIGVSSDPKEIAGCYEVGNGESALPDKVISGKTWKAFSLEDAGMMQYLKGISYRIIHDKSCLAIEEIETGSSYRDAAPSSTDISDTLLAQKFQELDSIISSFTFAHA